MIKFPTELQPGDIYRSADPNRHVVSIEPARQGSWIHIRKPGSDRYATAETATTVTYRHIVNGRIGQHEERETIANDYGLIVECDPERWLAGERALTAAVNARFARFLSGGAA